MDQDKDENDESGDYLFKRIPIIAIIFPPTRIADAIELCIKKNTQEE